MIGKFEPVLNAQIIGTLVAAVLTVAVAFNVPITEDQRNALLGLVGAVTAIFWGTAVVARNNVYPAAKVDDEIIPEAFRAGIASSRLGGHGNPQTDPGSSVVRNSPGNAPTGGL